MAYKGSTFGTLIVYVYPALVYLRLVDLPTWKDKAPPLLLIVFGASMCPLYGEVFNLGQRGIIYRDIGLGRYFAKYTIFEVILF